MKKIFLAPKDSINLLLSQLKRNYTVTNRYYRSGLDKFCSLGTLQAPALGRGTRMGFRPRRPTIEDSILPPSFRPASYILCIVQCFVLLPSLFLEIHSLCN